MNTKMTRLYGWAPSDELVEDAVPHRHWESTTLLSVLSLEGPVANLVYKGGTDVNVFEAFAQSQLKEVMRPGDILIMDNMATHKSPTIIGLLKEMGIEVKLLPPYSPDLNPIEKMFSQMKSHLKKWMKTATKSLCRLVGDALNLVTPENALGYFAHCGYGVE